MHTHAEWLVTDGAKPAEVSRAREARLTADAFSALYREQWAAVVNYARFRIGSEEAKDIAGEVFARAWAHRDAFDPTRGSAAEWLWGIARHATVDWARRPGRTIRSQGEELPSAADPSDLVEQADDVRRLLAAVSGLAPDDREVIALRFGLGLGNRDTARVLGLSDGNAAVRLHRALRRLRRDLGE
jgi:RNA polymerase sigma-70 factor, ECF subfamily